MSAATLSPGWATFGVALPQGVAPDALQVGRLVTQTDVKTRWPDGSVKFAVVSTFVETADRYDIHAAPPWSGRFTPQIPTASVRFTLGGQIYTATLPLAPSADRWLDGPLVQEGRAVVAPTLSNGAPHPFLRVIFDVRSYTDGQTRLDIAVENVLDQAGATSAVYDVAVTADGQTVFSRTGVNHPYLTRWRKVFALELQVSEIVPDLASFHASKALPRYLSLVANRVDNPTGPEFEILGKAGLVAYMPEHGGRPELAPYPDWTARYLVHRNPTQRRYVLAEGDLAGSWPVHVREPVGGTRAGVGELRLISIDERPNFWLDTRADDKPAGNLGARGPLTPDNAHVPSLAYVPYLLTGDRYYKDEMSYWADYVLLATYQDAFGNARQGSAGILRVNEVRGFAWGLRNLVDACAWLPDGDPLRAYLGEKIGNNLRWLETYTASHAATPLGVLWEGKRPEDSFLAPRKWLSTWEQNYLMWAIDRANDQGFPGATAHRDTIARFQLGLFTHEPDYRRSFAGAGVIAYGTRDSTGKITYYATWRDLFVGNFGSSPSGTGTSFAGYYGVDARLALMVSVREGFPGAQGAYDYLWPFIAVTTYTNGVPDLANRAGWAIARPGEP